ncbi:hypothetical protein HOY82DRAFT_620312 [Tuber indicum]|nr:hypothetical protein HOY82DRAFT_620312 [Tuber indicum]
MDGGVVNDEDAGEFDIHQLRGVPLSPAPIPRDLASRIKGKLWGSEFVGEWVRVKITSSTKPIFHLENGASWPNKMLVFGQWRKKHRGGRPQYAGLLWTDKEPRIHCGPLHTYDGKSRLGKGNAVLLDHKHNTARISHEKLHQDEGEGHQKDRSDDDTEDRDSGGIKHDEDERKAGYSENNKIPTGEDDDIDNVDFGHEGGVTGYHGNEVSTIQSPAGNPEQIRAFMPYRADEAEVSDKDGTFDLDSDLLSPNDNGGGDAGVQDKEVKCWEKSKKLMTEEQLIIVANVLKAVSLLIHMAAEEAA